MLIGHVTSSDRPPNIVWIFPDEWRHDAVGYAGNPVIRTPNLDALAARGTAFTGAHCESPVCAPSRASLLKVSYPRDHGKVQNGPAGGEFPPPDAPNFLHRLQAAGYRTGEVGKMHFFHGLHTPEDLCAYGFDDVAEEYDKVMQRRSFVVEMETPYTRYLEERGLLEDWREHQDEQTEIMFGRDPEGRRAIPDDLPAEHTLDAFIGRQVCDRIGDWAAAEEPFFLWAAFVGPHLPFDGPPPYRDLYEPDEIPMGPLGFDGAPDNRYGDQIREMRALLNSDGCTEADYRSIARHYYAAISLIDDQVGAIVEVLEEAGVAEDTWLVFSSDHGELLGDHGLLTKGVFYESSVKVPCLVVPPAGSTTGPRSVDDPVQGIDVPATILDVAGADASGFHGRSLVDGERGRAPGRTAVFSQIGDFTMVATERDKLVVTSDDHEPQAFHDLQQDPDERVNLVHDPAYADRIEALRRTFIAPYAEGRDPGLDGDTVSRT